MQELGNLEVLLEVLEILLIGTINPLSANFTKWSHTQKIRQQFADELFECV